MHLRDYASFLQHTQSDQLERIAGSNQNQTGPNILKLIFSPDRLQPIDLYLQCHLYKSQHLPIQNYGAIIKWKWKGEIKSEPH